MVPLLAAVVVGPMLAWKRGDLGAALQRLLPAAAAVIVILLVGLWLPDGQTMLALLGLALGIWLAVGAACQWAHRAKLLAASPAESFRRARGLPRAARGMPVAPFGVG